MQGRLGNVVPVGKIPSEDSVTPDFGGTYIGSDRHVNKSEVQGTDVW